MDGRSLLLLLLVGADAQAQQWGASYVPDQPIGMPVYGMLAVNDAARDWAVMCAAVELSGGAKSDFATAGGYPESEAIAARVEAAQPTLDALLQACEARAPALVATEDATLPLARLALWTDESSWARPLATWAGSDGNASVALRSLAAHLLEKWDTPSVLHAALAYAGPSDSASVPEAAHRVAWAFVTVQRKAGLGLASVKDALQEAVSDGHIVVSKAVAKHFIAADPQDSDPLHALRSAQVDALGGERWVVEGIRGSLLGRSLLGGGGDDGTAVCEPFGAAVIGWCVTHAAELQEPHAVATAIDFAIEMRRQVGDYSLAGRTPKTVREAMEAYALTSITFDSDERFMPNPRGLKGMFVTNATIPAGTKVEVPYDDRINAGLERLQAGYKGRYEMGEGSNEGRGATPSTVRITEVLSLKRLIHEGKMLNNCLEDKYDSQVKYVMRARQRVSSFWSFSIVVGDVVNYVLLAEVWHLRAGNIIRQAEGPRPRTIPGPEAWYWLGQWCEQEGIILDTWDIYSHVSAPVPHPPVYDTA